MSLLSSPIWPQLFQRRGPLRVARGSHRWHVTSGHSAPGERARGSLHRLRNGPRARPPPRRPRVSRAASLSAPRAIKNRHLVEVICDRSELQEKLNLTGGVWISPLSIRGAD